MIFRTSQYLEQGKIKMDPFLGLLSVKYHTTRMRLEQSEISTKVLHIYMCRICTDDET